MNSVHPDFSTQSPSPSSSVVQTAPGIRPVNSPSISGQHTSSFAKGNRSSVLSTQNSELSYDLSRNQWDLWDKAWGCHTEARLWQSDSSSSDDSIFSSCSSGSSKTSVAEDPSTSSPVKYPPPPRYPEVCINWLQGKCSRGRTCFYVHHDLEYDIPVVRKPTITASYTLTVREHIKVRCGPGFDIQEVITGFESPWLYISKIPPHINIDEVSRYLTQRGYPPQLVRLQGHMAKVRFASHIDARNANASVNGSVQWKETLSTRLAINNPSGRDAALQDTSVRLRWPTPSVVVYAGYRELEDASRAIEIANREYRTNFVSARLHQGLPAVNRHTVRFQNLPIGTKREDMDKYASPVDVMWDDPKYRSVDAAVAGIKRLLYFNNLSPQRFDVLPPPHRDGFVTAWVQFDTPSLASDAATLLHDRKPKCTGRTPVIAHHLQSLEYSVPLDEYIKIAPDVHALREWLKYRPKPLTTITTYEMPHSTRVRLSANDVKELGRLKAEFERIRGGELLLKDREIVWDSFFAQDHGRGYLRGVERKYPGVVIKEEIQRRRLKLFGPLRKRYAVKMLLLRKFEELNAMEEKIYLPRDLIGLFLRHEFPALQRTVGEHVVNLNLWESYVTVRGTKKDLRIVRQAVQKVGQRRNGMRPGNIASCPVCFGEVDAPFPLKCGHTYCRSCLTDYLNAATENRFFPLTCLGNNGTCGEPISLSVPRGILSPIEFDNVVDGAFQAYIHTRPKEFHYCPTPDCMQVYRTAPKGTPIQCPSCLLRICPECHDEYHDGFDCPDGDTEEDFKKWVDTHDVKSCPGCKIPIERAEGCNHVTCTRCQSHICWACLQTFPKGEGIYTHMRLEHGGIGLGPEDFVWEPFMV
ncbi:hypothetical protein K435DRAFT_117492 [Dendrothele bispora CBS 962.96]|uniref:RBR-type E3 ubiquitin transferase n=1 Tax=Dendrothele bispora (strain CBS 962.96) TaxID=1314807 RepID=A0A4S8MSA4_DENBC|nr:hypothetical protein K435DRAFT_117492 [Dendrothele bispora CBS 962.96]